MAVMHAAAGDHGAASWEAEQIRVLERGFSARRWLETYPMTDAAQKNKLIQALAEPGL